MYFSSKCKLCGKYFSADNLIDLLNKEEAHIKAQHPEEEKNYKRFRFNCFSI